MAVTAWLEVRSEPEKPREVTSAKPWRPDEAETPPDLTPAAASMAVSAASGPFLKGGDIGENRIKQVKVWKGVGKQRVIRKTGKGIVGSEAGKGDGPPGQSLRAFTRIIAGEDGRAPADKDTQADQIGMGAVAGFQCALAQRNRERDLALHHSNRRHRPRRRARPSQSVRPAPEAVPDRVNHPWSFLDSVPLV